MEYINYINSFSGRLTLESPDVLKKVQRNVFVCLSDFRGYDIILDFRRFSQNLVLNC